MLVSEMRATMTSTLLVSADSYGKEAQDRAFRYAAQRWIQRTHCTRTSGTKAMVSGTNTLDCSAITTFRPHRLLRAAISDRALKVVGYNVIEKWNDAGNTSSGEPEFIAFLSETEALLYPNPDSNYTLKLWFWEPVTIRYSDAIVTWTPGSDSNNIPASTINIPDEYMDDVIRYGAIPAMVSSAPDVLLRSGDWRHFETLMDEVAGSDEPDAGVLLPDEADYEVG